MIDKNIKNYYYNTMNNQPTIPEAVLSQISEHSSCFALFYFDEDGTPCFYQNFPEVKDRFALMKFLQDYVNTEGFPFGPPEDECGHEEDEESGGEDWKK